MKKAILLFVLVFSFFVESNLLADTYTHNIVAQAWTSYTSATLTGVNWTAAATGGGYWGYDATKGQQFGSGSNAATALSISTSGISGTISSVKVNTSGASSIAGNISVTVGGTAFTTSGNATQALTATATEYTFTGSGSGTIVLSWTQTSSKALYLKAITVEYATAPACTSSNLSFATPSYTKIVGAANFTQAATSLNQTTAITYSSSNSAVASVNSATGEVTIVGAGSATITATQDAGTHNAVSYCAATATYTIDVASNTPTITVTDITVPELTATVGNSDTETINISGVNLSENIILSLTGTNADQFSLSTYSVSQTAGTAANTLVVISYIPTTAGTHIATMSCTSAGATTVTRTLNGASSWASLSTPVATEGTGISDTGFTANWNAVSGATSYSLDVKKVTVSNNGSTSKLSENFAGFTGGTISTPGSEITSTFDTYTQIPGWTGTKVFQAGGAVKLGSGSALGNMTTPSIDLSAEGGSFTLTFKAVAWSGDATSVKVYLNNVLFQTVTGLSNDQSTFKTFTVNMTGGTSTSKIKIEGLQASSSRFFLDDVAITQSGLSTSEVAIDGSPFTVTENSKTFTGLTPGSTYKYSVIASNEHVTSTASNVVSVTTSGSTGLFPVFGGNDLQISVVNGKLLVNASVNQKIVLYNVAGQKVYEQRAAEGINTITVPVSGMYIVSVGTKSAKVIL